MEQFFAVATLWLALAVLSALIASHLRISVALVEICVGVAAAAASMWLGQGNILHADSEWLRSLRLPEQSC